MATNGTKAAGRGDEQGFTIVEVIVVVTIIIVLIAIFVRNADFVQHDRLAAASRQFYGDLQKQKLNALTLSPSAATSRGYGIRFTSGNAYTTFEFNDANNNYAYDGQSEEANTLLGNLPSSVTVTVWAGNPAAQTALATVYIFDKRGILRNADWSAAVNPIYVLSATNSSQQRCVQVDGAAIREGFWNGTACN